MSLECHCLDCGKEFHLNYADAQHKELDDPKLNTFERYKLINEYEKTIYIDTPKDICLNCLQARCDEEDGTKADKSMEQEQELKDLRDALKNAKDSIESKKHLEEIKILEGERLLPEKIQTLENKLRENEEKLQEKIKGLLSVYEEDQKFWHDFNSFEKEVYSFEKNKSTVAHQVENYGKDIKNFSSTTILNDLFKISFSGKAGIINSCNMGAPTSNTNYDQINAGWGYIVFLTKILTAHFGFNSSNLSLRYAGNYSYIEKNKERAELSISDNSRTIEKFNEAMALYLEFFGEFWKFLIENERIFKKDFKETLQRGVE